MTMRARLSNSQFRLASHFELVMLRVLRCVTWYQHHPKVALGLAIDPIQAPVQTLTLTGALTK